MLVEGLIGAVVTLLTFMLGWLFWRQNQMQQQLNDHERDHISREEADQLIDHKTHSMSNSLEEIKSELKELKNYMTEMIRWQGRQEGKEDRQNN